MSTQYIVSFVWCVLPAFTFSLQTAGPFVSAATELIIRDFYFPAPKSRTARPKPTRSIHPLIGALGHEAHFAAMATRLAATRHGIWRIPSRLLWRLTSRSEAVLLQQAPANGNAVCKIDQRKAIHPPITSRWRLRAYASNRNATVTCRNGTAEVHATLLSGGGWQLRRKSNTTLRDDNYCVRHQQTGDNENILCAWYALVMERLCSFISKHFTIEQVDML